jgi:hypothetical protein
MPILTRVTLRDDGTFALKPIIAPDGQGETWIDTRRACEIFGWDFQQPAARKRLYKLGDGGHVRVRRLTPGLPEYELDSLLRHKAAAQDRDFWDGKDIAAFRRAAVNG